MSTELKKIGAVAGGAFIGGAAMKMTKKSDGTSNPIGSIGAAGVGIYLAMKSKSPILKNLGYGLAAVGVVGVVGNVAQKVPMMQKFTPTINGLGELYEDEEGNIIELGGVNGPQLVQDSNGNTYMVDGLAGDDLNDLVGFEDEEFDEYEDLSGVGELQDLV
ncbi:hypothetical protein KDU71_02515 [Carboxylicivirga sediminis]|uniref:Uncharacterized protein n=1 Tax=Carboxylicivirga sediminis TaxID=2006564 RepID=A0A941IW45_9BACT|nr:hypothetical protein [Carboxylicivirga sediminis]MBR8534418.1 hypothetical protein [Carboxylicivirga sediminis]